MIPKSSTFFLFLDWAFHAFLLIAGISGHICDNCIEQAYEIVQEELKKTGDFDISSLQLIKPAEIKNFLDEYVIGQDQAKKYLSEAV